MKGLGQRKPLKQWLGGKKKMFLELLRKPGAMCGERRVSTGQTKKGIKCSLFILKGKGNHRKF